MKIFLDTANIEEIKHAISLGIIDGVTTNPTLIAKENPSDYEGTLKEILRIVKGPVSIEAISETGEEISKEALKLSQLSSNVVIKIPICEEGLKALKIIKEENLNIKTNVTLVFSLSQAILAAKLSANYISPFIGRLDDINERGVKLIEDIKDAFLNYSFKSEIIAASIRHPEHFYELALIGVDIVTIPYKILLQLVKHPLSELGIKKFKEDYNSIFKK